MERTRSTMLGGGGAVISSSGVAVPSSPIAASHEPAAQLTCALSVGRDAETAGQLVLESTRAAVKQFNQSQDSRSIQELGLLVSEFPNIVLRVPEFFDLMDWLFTNGRENAIARILGDAERGRPRLNHFFLVAYVDLVRKNQEGCKSVAKAAKWIATHQYGRFNKTAESIARDYSNHHERYPLWRAQYVPDEQLTPRAWCRPEQR